jgi:hypothetical protein
MSQIKHSFGDGPMVLPSDLLLSGIVPSQIYSGNAVEGPSEHLSGMSNFRLDLSRAKTFL